jgi:CRP-like cAMP-binding protein
MSLFTGEPRAATVVAVEETQVLRIGKEAVKQIFSANPELVNTISVLVEERRELLRSLSEDEKEIEERKEKRVLSSIRRFFGLK